MTATLNELVVATVATQGHTNQAEALADYRRASAKVALVAGLHGYTLDSEVNLPEAIAILRDAITLEGAGL